MKSDLKVWKTFLCHYNGITLIKPLSETSSEQIHLYTDSSKLGYGGTYQSHFICGPFPEAWKFLDIQVLELYPIFLLVHTFSQELKNSKVVFHCDNMSVVSALNKQTSRNKAIMSLLRPLVLSLLKYNIVFRAIHIPGKKNNLCDKLSRLQVTDPLLRLYSMDSLPTAIPQHLRPHNFKLM